MTAATRSSHGVFSWRIAAAERLLIDTLACKGLFQGIFEALTAPAIQESGLAPVQTAVSQRDCVLVIDASTSMLIKDWKPSRMGVAKQAATAFCARLASEDPEARVSIVAYGDSARTYCPLTPAKNLGALERAIKSIHSLGCTNINAGLRAALRLLKSAKSVGAGQVVLLSDGHNTEKHPKLACKELKRIAVIDCVGIGGSPKDVDEDLMKQIASEYPDGTKRYRWIGDKERLVKHFHHLAGRITRR